MALCLLSYERKGQRWRVNAMEHLIELYEMLSINYAALCESEQTAILRARLALSMFVRAMESITKASAEASLEAESDLPIAA